jgi:hypothetical protein
MSCVDGAGAQSYARRVGSAQNARAAQKPLKMCVGARAPVPHRAGDNFRRALLWCMH